MKLSSLSVFFPAFNDGATIPRLVKKTLSILPKITKDYEIIIINDGSKDNTPAVLEKLKKEVSCLKIITHPINRGYGAALKSGFKNAKNDFIFYTDGDGQYDVGELPNLTAQMKNDVDMVNGFKINRADNMLRKICGELYSCFTKLLFGLKIKDVDCDFRLIRKKVLKKIKLKNNSGAICVELIKKIQDAGFVIKEMPVHHYPRPSGSSTFFNPVNIAKTFIDDFSLLVFTKRFIFGVLILILALGFFLRFHNYAKFPRHGATFDEFAWTWQGISLWQRHIPTSWSPHSQYKNYELKKFQGAWVRLVTPYLEHPPIFGLVAGGFALATGTTELFDINLAQIRVLALIMGTISISLVFLLAYQLYDPAVGLLAALLYATIPTIVIGSRIVQNENFFIPVMLVTWLILLRFLKTQKNWQRNLAAVLAGLLVLAKIPWSALTLAACLLLAQQKRFRDAFIFGGIVLAFFFLFFVYGKYYDWQTFISLWGLQLGRAKIGLENVLALFTHPYLVDRLYPDGWIYFGWLAVLILSLNFKHHFKLLIPLLGYFLVFVIAIPGIEAQGWYRYPFYPFLTIASAVLIKRMLIRPSLMNLFFFFLIASSAFHWGWEEIFGLSNIAFRAIILLSLTSFLPPTFWPEKFTAWGRRTTYFWLVVFLILNIFSVLAHVHS